jgi:uracil-DNA glycosylase
VHAVQGQQFIINLIVTLDPTYLLRNPLDKAKAWDDLCLGLSVARQAPTP